MARLPKIITRLQDAYRAFKEGLATPYVDADDYQYRRLGGKTEHDFSPMQHERHQKIAAYLYDKNPFCKRMVDMQAEYMVGEGWKVESKDSELEDLLLSFWNSPVHNLELNLVAFIRELAIFGEQCYRMFINQFNGACEIGYIDPTLIAAVKLGANPLIIDTVFMKQPGSVDAIPLDGVKVTTLPAMSGDGSKTQLITGDTFFFKINSLLTATRGRCDFLTIFDLADLYDQFIFSRADRSILGNNIVHDITVENGSQTECDEHARKYGVMYPNRVIAHNEKVKYEIKNPNLRAEDASFDDRTICNYALGSFGFPEHFYGSGGSTNRATAMEMHEPVVKKLKTRQRFIQQMLNRMMDFVIFQARSTGYLRTKSNDYRVVFPEVSFKDMQRSGLTMMYLAQSLAIAAENRWLTPAAAAEVYAKVASGFGPDIGPNPDAPDSFDQLDKEASDEENQDGG